MKDFRPGRDRFLEPLIEIILCRRHRELESRHLDPLAPHALVPGRQHAGVVLLGRDHFVAGLEVDPVLGDLQRLAGAARQRHLFGFAPELRPHPQANGLHVLRDHALYS